MALKKLGSGDRLLIPAGSADRTVGVIIRDAAGSPKVGHPVVFEIQDGGGTFPAASGRIAISVRTDTNGEAWSPGIQPTTGGPLRFHIEADAAAEGEDTFVAEVTTAQPFNHGGVAPNPPPPPRGPWTAIAAVVIAALVVGGLILMFLVSKVGTASASTSGGTTVIKTGPAVDATARKDAQQALTGTQTLAANVDVFKAATATELANRATRGESQAYANEVGRATYRAALRADLARQMEEADRLLAEDDE